jgi:hypothetical protein
VCVIVYNLNVACWLVLLFESWGTPMTIYGYIDPSNIKNQQMLRIAQTSVHCHSSPLCLFCFCRVSVFYAWYRIWLSVFSNSCFTLGVFFINWSNGQSKFLCYQCIESNLSLVQVVEPISNLVLLNSVCHFSAFYTEKYNLIRFVFNIKGMWYLLSDWKIWYFLWFKYSFWSTESVVRAVLCGITFGLPNSEVCLAAYTSKTMNNDCLHE